ncbi:inositol 3-kinase-like [Helianthus annuus]|uniref:inositol 3-kinase-like n=1 Tax=Helianthus annuus TaxID=4232 RepID=UPI0016533D08|nr:inositol 3-kinase-like [Helianthus annuus]
MAQFGAIVGLYTEEDSGNEENTGQNNFGGALKSYYYIYINSYRCFAPVYSLPFDFGHRIFVSSLPAPIQINQHHHFPYKHQHRLPPPSLPNQPPHGLIVGNYCHDVLIKNNAVLAETLGGAAAFISAVLDGLPLPFTYVTKAGSDFAYTTTVNHPPITAGKTASCCVLVTGGEEGCTVYWKDGEVRIPAFSSVQVDPTGAGDSFLGSLVAGLVEGLAVPDAAVLGNFFGSLTVEQIGLPDFDVRLMQKVKDEVHVRKMQRDGHDDESRFTKTSGHEQFIASLVYINS